MKRSLDFPHWQTCVNDEGNLVYEFHVSEKHAPHSLLTISENSFGYIGDGTIYQYSMSGAPEALRKLFGNK